MNEIFVSYRRQGSADITGRIRHDLVNMFGQNQVFNDVYSVGGGENFRTAITKAIKSCKAYLVVMGPQWATIKDDKKGTRRLEDDDDNVRIELEAALSREYLPIIPLFVGGAKMPDKDDLPESLQGLVYYNGMRIGTGRDYDRDIDDLITEIEKLGIKRTSPEPGPNGGWGISKVAAMIGLPLVLAAIAAALYFGLRPDPQLPPVFDPPVDPTAEVSQSTVQQIQQALNAMSFVAGTEDGLVGGSTRAAISAFQRASNVRITGTPSAPLLIQLNRAIADGFSNVSCTTQNKSSQNCQPVTKSRTVPTTANQAEYLSGVLPCFYDINLFCDMFGNCNWPGIEQMCTESPGGLTMLQQQCFSYNGQISDYNATCVCNPMSCGCEIEANCNYTIQTTKVENYTETECSPTSSPVQQCTCKAPEVCPPNIR